MSCLPFCMRPACVAKDSMVAPEFIAFPVLLALFVCPFGPLWLPLGLPLVSFAQSTFSLLLLGCSASRGRARVFTFRSPFEGTRAEKVAAPRDPVDFSLRSSKGKPWRCFFPFEVSILLTFPFWRSRQQAR